MMIAYLVSVLSPRWQTLPKGALVPRKSLERSHSPVRFSHQDTAPDDRPTVYSSYHTTTVGSKHVGSFKILNTYQKWASSNNTKHMRKVYGTWFDA